MYFSISLGLGHKGFHRKLHLTTLLFNLYLGSILRNTYLPLKLCISLGNLYIYMYIETKRCTVLHFDITVILLDIFYLPVQVKPQIITSNFNMSS